MSVVQENIMLGIMSKFTILISEAITFNHKTLDRDQQSKSYKKESTHFNTFMTS